MRRVLLAVDETEGSRRAAEFVEQFFADMDVSVTAVNVARSPIGWLAQGPPGWMPPVPYGGLYGWPWRAATDDRTGIDEAFAREEREARSLAAAQAPPGSEVDVVFGDGDPADAIAAAADEHHADLIVVGSNDKSLLDRWFGRSTSEELAREVPRPVLVVG